MKNIQVIDGAQNCTHSIFQATDEEFDLLFPDAGQEVQFAEDFVSLPDQKDINAALARIWDRPIRKRDAQGIHGTLFYGLEKMRLLYRQKREDGVEPWAINHAQRQLFGMT
jgi:hypothetical protein